MPSLPFSRRRRSEVDVRGIVSDVVEELADRTRLGQDRQVEFGAAGTIFFNGIAVSNEYNNDLRGEKAITIYDRMWRSDGQIGALINACELPLLEAEWIVSPASDDTQDVEVAQFVQDNLMTGMTRTWRATLEHILTMLRYGYAVTEKVYVYDKADNKIKLKKLAPRLAKTIYRWYVDPETDELDHIQQRVYKLDKPTEAGQSGSYRFLDIPGAKLVVFTHRRDGNNFEGVSILRQAYKHWFYKDQFYHIDAIANERHALGIPTFKEPQAVQAKDRDAAAKTLMSLHAHEKNYVLIPYGWEFEFAQMNAGTLKDVMPSIEHHDLMIARSILAQFLNLDQGGSYALSRDGSSLFLQALQSVAKTVCETIDKDLIRELVDLNFQVERYPRLTVSKLDKRNIEDLLGQIPGLFTAKVLTYSSETEQALRKLIGLPDLPEETIQRRDQITQRMHEVAMQTGAAAPEETAQVNGVTITGQQTTSPASTTTAPPRGAGGVVDTGSQGQAATGKGGEQQLALRPFPRELTTLEKTADLASIDSSHDRGRDTYKLTILPLAKQQLQSMTKAANKFIARGEHVDATKIEVPYKAKVTDAIVAVMRDLFDSGRRQVLSEYQAQTGKAETLSSPTIWTLSEEEITRLLQVKARSIASILAIKMQSYFALAVARLADEPTDVIDAETEDGILTAIERDLNTTVGTAVSDSINIGRAFEAGTLHTNWAQYSALLDSETCSNCAAQDGKVFKVDSPQYAESMPPYHACRGWDNCRCVYFYDFTDGPDAKPPERFDSPERVNEAGQIMRSGELSLEATSEYAAGSDVAGLAVVARDTSRVLLLQRANTPDDPAAGMWEFPGGHVDPEDTSLLNGARREWEEETGLKLPDGTNAGEWHIPMNNGGYTGFVFVIDSEDLIPLHDRDWHANPDNPDGDIFESIAWWSPDQLENNSSVRTELRQTAALVIPAIKHDEEAQLANPYHDAKGQFTSANGAIAVSLWGRDESGWRPTMSPDEADRWAEGSKITEPVYHFTRSESVDLIKSGGFMISDGVLGEFVYTTNNASGNNIGRSRASERLDVRIRAMNPFEGTTREFNDLMDRHSDQGYVAPDVVLKKLGHDAAVIHRRGRSYDGKSEIDDTWVLVLKPTQITVVNR